MHVAASILLMHLLGIDEFAGRGGVVLCRAREGLVDSRVYTWDMTAVYAHLLSVDTYKFVTLFIGCVTKGL